MRAGTHGKIGGSPKDSPAGAQQNADIVAAKVGNGHIDLAVAIEITDRYRIRRGTRVVIDYGSKSYLAQRCRNTAQEEHQDHE